MLGDKVIEFPYLVMFSNENDHFVSVGGGSEFKTEKEATAKAKEKCDELHGRSGSHGYGRARPFSWRCACAHSRCDHTCRVDVADRDNGSVITTARASLSVLKHW